jgi:hypothetical protein
VKHAYARSSEAANEHFPELSNMADTQDYRPNEEEEEEEEVDDSVRLYA